MSFKKQPSRNPFYKMYQAFRRQESVLLIGKLESGFFSIFEVLFPKKVRLVLNSPDLPFTSIATQPNFRLGIVACSKMDCSHERLSQTKDLLLMPLRSTIFSRLENFFMVPVRRKVVSSFSKDEKEKKSILRKHHFVESL